MIQARTGVEFDLDRNAQTDQRSIDRDRIVHKFTLYFKDFYGKTSTMTIALRLDVTEFGRLYLPIQQRNLIHPYSDPNPRVVVRHGLRNGDRCPCDLG